MMLVPAINEPGEIETMADERRLQVPRRPAILISHSQPLWGRRRQTSPVAVRSRGSALLR